MAGVRHCARHRHVRIQVVSSDKSLVVFKQLEQLGKDCEIGSCQSRRGSYPHLNIKYCQCLNIKRKHFDGDSTLSE